MGITKDKLLSSIDTYIKVINDDESSFSKSMEEEFTEEVTKKRNQITNNNEVIEKLNKQIQELQTSNLQLQQDANVKEISIQQTSNEYSLVSKNTVAILESDKLKINQYLQ